MLPDRKHYMPDTIMEQKEDEMGTTLPSGERKSRILIVDDNEDSATSLAAMFDILGYEACVAFDGIAAVEVTESFNPDVVLMDIGLPKMSGLDAARKIREQAWGQALFLIAVTGWGDEKDRLQSAAAGFDMHLVKPIDPAVLEKLLLQHSKAAAGDRVSTS